MSFSLTVAAWLATYALHSTILLVLALIASRIVRSESARETLWKAAIIGPLLTATIPSLAGFTPAIGRWTVADASTTSVISSPTTSHDVIRSDRITANSQQAISTPSNDAAPNEPRIASVPFPLAPWLIGLWALVSLALITRIFIHHRRLFRDLSNRHPVANEVLPGMLAELRRKAAMWKPVRLTASPSCATPIALGRMEICVPERFATDLDAEQQRSALAHELAHLQRRDPIWQLAVGVIASVFFFQPLNVVGRKRLRDAAEYLCDDWAVQQTNAPLALARCLTQIGSWVGTAAVPEAMLAMAEGGAPLISRIERLASWKSAGRGSAGATTVLATVVIVLVGMSAPVLSAPRIVGDLKEASTRVNPVQQNRRDTVIAYPGNDPQSNKWAWVSSQAQSRDGTEPYWIGWEVDGADSHGVAITSNSRGVFNASATAPRLVDLVGGATSGRRAAILIRAARKPDANAATATATRIQWIDDNISLGGTRILWIGRLDSRESISQLSRYLNGTTDSRIREELAAALTLHSDGVLTLAAVKSLMQSEGNAGVRTEAVQWLARLHGSDLGVIAFLSATATTGKDSEVRLEAVDGLRTVLRNGDARARNALNAIANGNGDMRVRSEAMQTLTRTK